MKLRIFLLFATIAAGKAFAGDAFVGLVKVEPRPDVGLEVTVDREPADGIIDDVLLVQTTSPSDVVFKGRALVSLDAGGLRIVAQKAGPLRALVALLRPGATLPVGWTAIPDVIGVVHSQGQAARTPEAIRLATPEEINAWQAEQRIGAAELAKELKEAPDAASRELAKNLEAVAQSPCSPGVPCYPEPPPDDPSGGYGITTCSRSCPLGYCFVLCRPGYQPLCSCTPGTGSPVCSCITNYPR